MSKSVAWAYGLAGVVVAVAVIVVAVATVGLTEGGGAPESAATLSTDTLPGALGAGVASSEIVTTASGEQVEYVYVDQPAAADHNDDDDEDDEEEEDERYGHDDDDDDDHHDDREDD